MNRIQKQLPMSMLSLMLTLQPLFSFSLSYLSRRTLPSDSKARKVSVQLFAYGDRPFDLSRLLYSVHECGRSRIDTRAVSWNLECLLLVLMVLDPHTD
jgi:hypothetical protein